MNQNYHTLLTVALTNIIPLSNSKTNQRAEQLLLFALRISQRMF